MLILAKKKLERPIHLKFRGGITADFPIFDFALEFEKKKIRIYSEAQTGIAIAGISSGPLLEFNWKESKKIYGGFQSSVWGNYIFGMDIRYRNVAGNSYFCPGAYIKIPATIFNRDGHDDNYGSSWDSDWDYTETTLISENYPTEVRPAKCGVTNLRSTKVIRKFALRWGNNF